MKLDILARLDALYSTREASRHIFDNYYLSSQSVQMLFKMETNKQNGKVVVNFKLSEPIRFEETETTIIGKQSVKLQLRNMFSDSTPQLYPKIFGKSQNRALLLGAKGICTMYIHDISDHTHPALRRPAPRTKKMAKSIYFSKMTPPFPLNVSKGFH